MDASNQIQGVVAMDVEAFCSTIAEMHDVKEQAIYLAQSLGLDFLDDFLLSWKKTWRFFWGVEAWNHYCWWDRNPGSIHQLRLVVYPIILLGFMHPRWLFGISEPSTVPLRIQPGFLVRVILHVYYKMTSKTSRVAKLHMLCWRFCQFYWPISINQNWEGHLQGVVHPKIPFFSMPKVYPDLYIHTKNIYTYLEPQGQPFINGWKWSTS